MNDVDLFEKCNEIENESTTNVGKTDLLVNLSFGESNEQRKFSNDLLNSPEIDLFSNDELNAYSKPMTTDDLLSMDQSPDLDDKLVFPTNASFNPNNISKMGNNLKSKNPSTPNLATAFDPFADLGDYLNFPSETNHCNKPSIPVSIPRVASFNDFPDDSKTIKSTTATHHQTTYQAKQTRPDYSRHNFDDIFPRTGLKAPRVNGNEFEDLLCGFKKNNPESNANKTMAQIRKAEMVYFYQNNVLPYN